MARIFITGSSDGIGLHAARTLISNGHQVTLHARNDERAAQTRSAVPGAVGIITGDISTLDGMKALATRANQAEHPFDVVIHNAGVGFGSDTGSTSQGMKTIFAVNSLAPYVLTALMARPKRLIYTTSVLHTSGDATLNNITQSSYDDTKLHNVILANAIARRWTHIESNSVDPGWVSTKLGGRSAPGSTQSGADTLVDLANPDLSQKIGTGHYFSNRRPTEPVKAGEDLQKQDQLLAAYEKLSGIKLPIE